MTVSQVRPVEFKQRPGTGMHSDVRQDTRNVLNVNDVEYVK